MMNKIPNTYCPKNKIMEDGTVIPGLYVSLGISPCTDVRDLAPEIRSQIQPGWQRCNDRLKSNRDYNRDYNRDHSNTNFPHKKRASFPLPPLALPPPALSVPDFGQQINWIPLNPFNPFNPYDPSLLAFWQNNQSEIKNVLVEPELTLPKLSDTLSHLQASIDLLFSKSRTVKCIRCRKEMQEYVDTSDGQFNLNRHLSEPERLFKVENNDGFSVVCGRCVLPSEKSRPVELEKNIPINELNEYTPPSSLDDEGDDEYDPTLPDLVISA